VDKLLLTIVKDAHLALRISRTDHLFLVFVIPLYLHFTMAVLGYKGLRLVLRTFYLLTFVLLPFTQKDLYLEGVSTLSFGFFAQAGPLFNLFLCLSGLSIGLSFALLVRGLSSERVSVERLRIKYVLLSFGLAAILNHFDVLAMKGYDFYPLGNFVFVPMSLMAYALYRYDLMDWAVFLNKGLNFILLFFVATSVFFASYTVLNHILPNVGPDITAFLSFFTSFVSSYSAFFWVQRFVFHFLEKETEERIRKIRDLSLQVLRLRDVEQIKRMVEQRLKEILNVETCELRRRGSEGVMEGLLHPKDPLFSSGFRLLFSIPSERLPSVLLLGEKREMRVFRGEEISVLSLLSNHLALSFDNALNFRELKDLTASLERIVEERTNELVRSESLAGLGRLAAGVAHELNNPIAAVMSTLEYLRDHMDEADPLRDDLSCSLNELGRARDMVRSLLDTARQGEDVKEPTDIHRPIEHALRVLGAELKRKKVRLEKDFGAKAPYVLGNPSRLAQVFINILKNAIDATEGGTIRVETADLSAAVKVRITDTGEGMEESHLREIFRPFFTTKKGKGLGLGLFVVRQIVDEHGGTIEVKSKKGEGTEFSLTFPAHPR